MSSYEPLNEENEGSNHDPGAMGSDVTDDRSFSSYFEDWNKSDYALAGAAASIFSGGITTVAVAELYPEYKDTAAEILRELGFEASKLASEYPEVFDTARDILEGF